MQIKKLKLYTSKLQEQTAFYSKTLGLEITNQTKNTVCFQIGNSLLEFEEREHITPYHYAINIPVNKVEAALGWLKERVEILKDGEYEIQNFDFWNAKAIYFHDKENNIVEFIARKNLKNPSHEPFTAKLLLEISEIGLPTNDIQKEFTSLQALANLAIFSGGFERFCAIGDEHGLFICINKNNKDWFPTNEKAYSSDFDIHFIENNIEYKVQYKNEELVTENLLA